MKILALGINGQLGSSFVENFVGLGLTVQNHDQISNTCLIDLDFKSITRFSPHLDITDRNRLQKIILDSNPDVVINCCAATDVDLIEKFPTSGISSNVIGPININEICKSNGIKQIYFSTEAAYDGANQGKYLETALEIPQSTYALTKVVADQIILNSKSQAWIFRTSWLYSINSPSSFVTRILQKSRTSSSQFGVTDDLFGNPTPAWWLARTVINLLKDLDNLPTGLYHLCSSIAVSKYDWAKRIITDLNPEKVSLIVPTKRNDFPNAHLRSPYVDLSTDKIQSYLGKSLIPTWEELWNESIK